eukprot:CAMPEP_0117021866 /NCGR_PEP_ID=MMETSP0472-20121206/16471_1 /TAXON_ID=693140 ORGANISM="Tiarina fusus, Strain LIS" /NCGR_SAMPLE_ID=MMETSP0472 /ASSEMBLY_ACC=CAM_ASM_000603 /LENGTH=99 /DNA_ID=CAMNT_0004727513 /DNA_START=232 /DNA_END=528 /DNA_ORIENTATION=-
MEMEMESETEFENSYESESTVDNSATEEDPSEEISSTDSQPFPLNQTKRIFPVEENESSDLPKPKNPDFNETISKSKVSDTVSLLPSGSPISRAAAGST